MTSQVAFFISFCISIASIILIIGIKCFLLRQQVKTKHALLEITPPHDSKRTPLATEQLFNILHSLGGQKTIIERLLNKKKLFSLEVVSTKEEGIRFLVRVADTDTHILKKHLLSYLPEIRIAPVAEYLSYNKEGESMTLRLTRSAKYSLQEQTELSQHDPIAYLTGQMTKLKKDEMITLQYIVTPVNQDALSRSKLSISSIIFFLSGCLLFLTVAPFTLLGWILFSDNKEALPFWIFQKKQKVTENPSEKQTKKLFEATLRISVFQASARERKDRIKGLFTSYAVFHKDKQELRIKKSLFLRNLRWSRELFSFQRTLRLLSITNNPILSTTELASLFHFPYTSTTNTEDLITLRYKQLSAPLSLKKNNNDIDIVFANNVYAESITPIGLTKDERRRHMYLVGATGTGKTTLLARMIKEDIDHGKGVCVIDPHGDLLQTCLASVPEERVADVVFFNPLDRKYPIGLNLLEMKKGLTDEQLEDEKDLIASSFISIFHKLYSAKYLGPRMEHILRFAILTVLETENPTLFTLQRVLTDDKYRSKIVATLKDPVVKDFWLHEFKQFGSYQKADAVSPITNKLGRFLSSPLCRNILGQYHTTIDFEEVMNDGKILLCNLPKGRIGEDNSTLFGVLITAKIQLAALRRANISEQKRRDFYLYIDEFQNFATPSFAQIMSEARKYRLNAILAHQTIAQLEDQDLIKIILANTGTILSFRTASPLDEEYLLPLFAPQVTKGEIANLPSFSFYIKNNAIIPQNTFSGETVPLDTQPNQLRIQAIETHSQQTYGVPREVVTQMIKEQYDTPRKERTVSKMIQKSEKYTMQ